MKKITPLKAIRLKCLDCTVGQIKEIREDPILQILLQKSNGFLKESCKLLSKYAMTKTIQKKVRFAQSNFFLRANDIARELLLYSLKNR